jgi:hypothetical protein
MSDDRTWSPTHETPSKTLRALIRRLDAGTSTDEIVRVAGIHLPEWRVTETRVENIRAEVADAHELARTHRWFAEQDDPPAVTLSDERRLSPADTDGVVHRAEIDAIVGHRLRGRASRTCENPDGVIGCHGPDGFGYRCPDCGQQRRREQAILDELLNEHKRDRLDSPLLTEPTETETDTETETEPKSTAATDSSDESTETKTEPTTPLMPRATTSDDDRATDEQTTVDENTETDRTQAEGQSALDAFANGDGGEFA